MSKRNASIALVVATVFIAGIALIALSALILFWRAASLHDPAIPTPRSEKLHPPARIALLPAVPIARSQRRQADGGSRVLFGTGSIPPRAT